MSDERYPDLAGAIADVALATGWITSIVFVSAASIYANAATHLAAARADSD